MSGSVNKTTPKTRKLIQHTGRSDALHYSSQTQQIFRSTCSDEVCNPTEKSPRSQYMDQAHLITVPFRPCYNRSSFTLNTITFVSATVGSWINMHKVLSTCYLANCFPRNSLLDSGYTKLSDEGMHNSLILTVVFRVNSPSLFCLHLLRKRTYAEKWHGILQVGFSSCHSTKARKTAVINSWPCL